MNRRRFLVATSVSLGFWSLPATAAAAGSTRDLRAIREDWKRLLPAGAEVPAATPPLSRTLDEWRAELPADSFQVLFEEGTERPFTSPLNDETRQGVFLCAACRLPLFTSEMEFDSGTGWPSFFTHIPGHVATKTDYKLVWPRTEYHCTRCGGHQGHVFDDGPPPTGERWCNNGVALRFVAAAS